MVVGPAALGMTRLAIIDLASGQQPIANEDKSIWIVFNGEIYNFRELQKLLRERGHTLATNSDTEVIVHLYEEYGAGCLQYLEGMFAFALWDARKNELFVARDRMGEKPLHWAIFGNQFVFGSEIKSILEHPSARRELNPTAMRKYLALEYVPAPDTLFAGIYKLRPAHYMVVADGKITTVNYWRPGQSQLSGITDSEAVEQWLSLLDSSIAGRLISDVPLGVFLSGGIDSSGIAALAAKQVSGKLRTFSIGFADKSYDESAHARAVAEYIASQHDEVTFSPADAFQMMQELWAVLDEPLADASILPTYFLSKMTRRSVTVALSGDGGDELFGGYPTYQAHSMAAIYNRLPATLRQGLIEPAVKALPVSLNNLSFDYKAKRFISAAAESPYSRHLRWMGAIALSQQASLIKPELMRSTVSGASEETLLCPSFDLFWKHGNNDVVDSIMRLDLGSYLPEDLLVKSDRASMAASLEVRIPFLAYPLVEFALSLPTSLKLRGRTTKYLPKIALQSLLPESILRRPKKGFGIPVAKWIRSELLEPVRHYLGSDYIARQGIFQAAYVSSIVEDHLSGRADRRKELWTLLMFQIWHEKFFGAPTSLTTSTSQQVVAVGPS